MKSLNAEQFCPAHLTGVTGFYILFSRMFTSNLSSSFSTTPFFISFTDDPKTLRRALHCYLNALIADFMGDHSRAKVLIEESYRLNRENLSALDFQTQGFLP